MPTDLNTVIKSRISVLAEKGDKAAKLSDRRHAREDAALLRSILAEAKK